jgi:hypothetical protein
MLDAFMNFTYWEGNNPMRVKFKYGSAFTSIDTAIKHILEFEKKSKLEQATDLKGKRQYVMYGQMLHAHGIKMGKGKMLTEYGQYKEILETITDLSQDSDTGRKLFKAFQRAKGAAERATNVLRWLGDGRKAGYDPNFVHLVLMSCFPHVEESDDIFEVAERFAKTHAGLSSNDIIISDAAGRGGEIAGYVVPKSSELGKNEPNRTADQKGSIHIQFYLAKRHSVDFCARTILHEATHKYANTDDMGGAWGGGSSTNSHPFFESMLKDDAKNNADSYAIAGISLLKQKLVSHTDLLAEPK